jgi:hypothetical protein
MWEIYNDQVGQAKTSKPHQLLQVVTDWGINWVLVVYPWVGYSLTGKTIQTRIGSLCVPRVLQIVPNTMACMIGELKRIADMPRLISVACRSICRTRTDVYGSRGKELSTTKPL